MIALAVIVKPDDNEAKYLYKLLANVSPYVDGIFVTQAYLYGNNKYSKGVSEVCKSFGAVESKGEFDGFAEARNFNWSQVPEEYTHILWADADDVFRGLEKLKEVVEENPGVDAFVMNYLYHFDEWKHPDVVHMKTQLVKNDGCVRWVGKLHEDFEKTRNIVPMFIEGIERMHMSEDNHFDEAKERNLIIAQRDVDANPNDPRSYWNLANSQRALGKLEEAVETFQRFNEDSNSDEEKYASNLRIAETFFHLGKHLKAVDAARVAIGYRPHYPDAYVLLGEIYSAMEAHDEAIKSFAMGLKMEPPYHEILVYNPRDYDYRPIMGLAKVYFKKGKPTAALPLLKECLKIYPERKDILDLIKVMEDEVAAQKAAKEVIDQAEKADDRMAAKILNDSEQKDHPMVMFYRNKRFIKTKSSGKDLVIYCYPTEEEWNPKIMEERGMGGSEEAVIHLSKQLASHGWNVTVYNNCGEEMQRDGVTWKPFWLWNFRNKEDVTILWRIPKACDYDINSDKIFIDLHDTIMPGEFKKDRLDKIDRIFVKTKFHRSLYPEIPDEKFAIIPNGMDFSLFNQDVIKDQYLMVNTSAPNRSLETLIELFPRIKEQVPEARLQWAYGWQTFDIAHSNDKHMLEWKERMIEGMKQSGIEDMGRVSQKDAVKMYLEANILAYPTEFPEIDCITVKKAQACGALPITTDFAALDESVKYGVKVPVGDINWKSRDIFSLSSEESKDEWVKAAVDTLKTPMADRSEMKEWTEKFRWENIGKLWNEIICE